MMRNARYVLLAVLIVMWPATAHAGFWAWLEELSGPGPFKGDVFTATVLCIGADGERKLCAAPGESTRRMVALRVAWFNSDPDKPRFKDLPAADADNRGKVSVLPVTALYLFHLRPWLDAGGGAGFMRVSGDGFSSFYRLMLTPVSVTLTPFAINEKWQKSQWSQVLRLELDTSYIPQGFKGADFQNSRTSFDSGAEFLTRAATIVDLGALVGATRSTLHR